MTNVVKVSDNPEPFFSALNKSKDLPIFIKFYADWCGHCKNMAADWQRLLKNDEVKDRVAFIEVKHTALPGIKNLFKSRNDLKQQYKGIEKILNATGFGYPTLVLQQPNGNVKVAPGRTEKEMVNFLLENIKTKGGARKTKFKKTNSQVRSRARSKVTSSARSKVRSRAKVRSRTRKMKNRTKHKF